MEDSSEREKKRPTFNLWNDAQILTHLTSNVDRAPDYVRMKIFNAPVMPSRTYNRNSNENYYNTADRASLDYLKTSNDAIPSYSVNTVHLQNPYRPPQRLEGFASRDHTKGIYRSQDFTLRSRYNNLFAKKESPANKNNDQANGKTESIALRSKTGKKHERCTEISELAKQYCSYSTLHGLRYVGDSGLSIVERIFWIISFTTALTVAIYYICYLYQKWNGAPIIISLSPDPISLNEFPFPSVTICNMNKVKKTEAKRIERGLDELDKLLMEDICNSESNVTYEQQTVDWDRMLRFMINVSQPCTDMLYYCLWHGNQTDCERIFNPTMTDEGICCNFNSVTKKHLFYNARDWPDLNITYPSESVDWNAEKGYDASMSADVIPWRPYGAGLIYGLTLALDVDMNEYYCSSTAGAGFKMLLHNPVETPKVADFSFAITPGEETRVIVRPRISTANPAIISIPQRKRKCFFTAERKLRYYRTYTQRNCILECEANFTQQLCDCVQYYMPKSSNTPICGKKDEPCAKRARRAMEVKLYDEDLTSNITKIPSCNCWPGCFEISYRVELSQNKLIPNFQIDKRYMKKDINYFTENMAVVHLFFVDSQFTKYVKNELFGFIEFLSSTGGLLGLFMGFSFLSFMEILYFSTIRVWCRLINRREYRRPTVTHPIDDNKKVIYPFRN
ncbi:pickpocket protein 28-like isoform X1 [Temnothorax curvispinosus]|uniref:Pickpocket protein 28-like isoform X1 n=1 Tax=Temnothorax curvispinosus TaxID=300111 RepID=A0A6J1R2D4_9HYME|nr:pickpocket protein 28-like isoform X1 [Temnothorax curvispinosus]XP_024889163.1 pickpocket protein 28-like isoform X1 [Temnothorax curvispinosus]XP_024889164.1 pickpocket protein 28-like isoform X1 [Temnothorax curvispinosus]